MNEIAKRLIREQNNLGMLRSNIHFSLEIREIMPTKIKKIENFFINKIEDN